MHMWHRPLGGAIAALCAGSLVSAQIEIVTVGENEVSFDALEQKDAGAGNPADPVVAVDFEDIVVVANRAISVFDKDSLTLRQRVPLGSFFDVDTGYWDVGIAWDPEDEQFIVSALKSGYTLAVAYSDGGALDSTNPLTTGWSFIYDSTSYSNGHCVEPEENEDLLSPDQPSIGFTADEWWVAAVMYRNGSHDDADNLFLHIDKATHAHSYVYASECDDGVNDLGCLSYTSDTPLGRAIARATVPGGGEDPPFAYFVGIVAPTTGTIDTVRLFAIDTSGTKRFFDLEVEEYDPSILRAPTCDTAGPLIEAVEGRISGQAHYRDGYLYFAHSIVGSVYISSMLHDQRIIRWYKVDLNGWPSGSETPEVDEWHEIDAGTSSSAAGTVPVHLYLPAISANEDGDVAIVMAQSSEHDKLSIQATGRDITETSPEFGRKEIWISDGCISPSGNQYARWGDYFDIMVDPEDDDTFWVVGSYMKEDAGGGMPAEDGWAIRVAQIKVVPDP